MPQATVNVMPQHIAKFIAAIVVMVVIQIVGHAAIAIVGRNTDTDERDRLISLKGTRLGAYVLAFGVMLALCTALLTEGNFVFPHVLFGCWVLAQLTEYASCLFLYRTGA